MSVPTESNTRDNEETRISTVTILQMPDEFMCSVFRRLTLYDLLQVQIVGKQLNQSIRQFCQSIKSLKFIDGDFDEEHDDFHRFDICPQPKFVQESIVVKKDFHLNYQRIEKIVQLFPCVDYIHIHNYKLSTSNLEHLFVQPLIADNLVTLKLMLSPHVKYNFLKIATALNGLKSLKHLSLCNFLMRNLMKTLSNLNSFYLQGYKGHLKNVFKYFDQENLHALALNSCKLNLSHLEDWIKAKPNVTSQLNYLKIDPIDIHKFKFVCENFSSLISLNITFDNYIKIENILPELIQLKQLTKFRLCCQVNYDHGVYEGDPFTITDSISIHELQSKYSLRTIKSLCLDFEMNPHTFFIVSDIFPNVERLEVGRFHYECQCGGKKDIGTKKQKAKINHKNFKIIAQHKVLKHFKRWKSVRFFYNMDFSVFCEHNAQHDNHDYWI